MNNTTSNKSKMVPIVGILLVVCAVLYFFFWRGSETVPADTALTKTKAGPGNVSLEEDLLKTLKEVKTLKLNDDVLRSSFFVSSIDFTKILTREPKFRTNPFAPIGNDAIRSQNTVSNPSLAPLPQATTSPKSR